MVSEFDLHYIFEKSIMRRVVFDFLAGFDFSNEVVLEVQKDVWTMYLDEASNQKGFG